MFEQAEKQKRELTDKYVVVDATVPELMRFEGHVGQVKTVNMNGRALVQFDAWNNIGWYDIEVDYLKVVPKPEVMAAEKKPESKPAPPSKEVARPAAGEKKLSPLEMARLQGAAKRPAAEPAGEKAAPAAKLPPAGAAKKSTADILAAARAAKAAPPAAAEQSPAPAASGKLSTAEILAAARARQATAAPVATTAATIVQPPAPAKAAAEQPLAAAPSAATVVKPKPASGPALPSGQRPSLSEILAWCREHDGK